MQLPPAENQPIPTELVINRFLVICSSKVVFATGGPVCRSVDGTTVDPSLPPCFALAMPSLRLHIGPDTNLAADNRQYRQPHSAESSWTMLLLMLGALAAAVLLGQMCRRRRMPQGVWQQCTTGGLLGIQRPVRAAGETHVAGNQARFRAQVLAALGSHRQNLHMLPPDLLPATLMHQMKPSALQSADGGWAGLHSRTFGAADASDAQTLLAASRDAGVALSAVPDLTARLESGINGWLGSGMLSQSLRLAPGELQVGCLAVVQTWKPVYDCSALAHHPAVYSAAG